MPLVRVELPRAKLPTIEQRWASMWRSRSPLEKRFQIFTEHAPGNLVIDGPTSGSTDPPMRSWSR